MNLAPPVVRIAANCRSLDKALLSKTINVPAVRAAAPMIGELRSQILKDRIISYPRLKTIYKDEADDSKRILLLETELPQDYSLPEGAEKTSYSLYLDFSFWTADEILQAVLPEGIPIPSSFEQVGHLIHLNLLPAHEDYKHVIAEILLAKNSPHCRTVINKTSPIQSTFRTFEMEILAGEADTVVSIRESDCWFNFDYAKVYWNSRLQHEHHRLVDRLFQKGQLVCDVFAGVGPFAVPAAKLKQCTVHANDLNPESFRFLQQNVVKNKVAKLVSTYNLDARDFVRQVFFEKQLPFDHIVMNLPAVAHEFLDVFACESAPSNPTIHCYVFVKGGEQAAKELCESVLKRDIEPIDIHYVRNVAPGKDMYCVSFNLTLPCKKPRTE